MTQSTAIPIPDDSAAVLQLPVIGMSCASCVRRVEQALLATPGVSAASVNLASEKAEVALAADGQTQALLQTVKDCGYETRTEQYQLSVIGMSCASCVGKVEKALLGLPGVLSAQVNLAAETATVEVLAGNLDAAALIKAVRTTGYDATPLAAERDDDNARREQEQQQLQRDFWLAAGLTLPVFVLEMGAHIIPGMQQWLAETLGQPLNWGIQLVLTTLVLFGPGRRFLSKGLPALWRRAPDMNSLVALGSLSAWGFSLVVTLPGNGCRKVRAMCILRQRR